ncbi:YciI family protein [Fulvivirga sp.]|uniref:YciI family protein n=1 Tax=Fulvivirga sp. TaxID=1931237 RepID=UPI0032ED1785
MKTLLLTLLMATGTLLSQAQDEQGNPPDEIVKYYFIELITNPDKPELPKAQVDSIQREHMKNINQMVVDKQLMLAGPFENGGGIFIVNVKTLEEAEALAARDPAVKSGRLLTKVRPWYTTKGSFGIEFKKDN